MFALEKVCDNEYSLHLVLVTHVFHLQRISSIPYTVVKYLNIWSKFAIFGRK